MFTYTTLNPISKVGTDHFTDVYKAVDTLDEAQAALVRSASMHELDLPENLVCVARAGAGVNNIPLDKCADKGIVVFNTPGANANGVKEMVIAGMLLASRDIVSGIEWVRQNKDEDNIGKMAEKQKKQFAGCEIAGKKLGIIGLGAIGVKVANAAVHLGMEVYGYDPYISVDAAWNLSRSIKHINNVEDIYRECDYITIHVPLMDSTKNMIDAEAIDMMKDGVVLLNYARDLLVDEKALVEALHNGKVKKYVSDFANPTVAGATAESEDNCAEMAVQEIRDYMENGNIKHSVNYPDCDFGVCTSAGRVTICHKNVVNMINKFTKVLGDMGMNIATMTNKSKGEYAYTIIDVESVLTEDVVEKLSAIEDVLKVRIVK